MIRAADHVIEVGPEAGGAPRAGSNRVPGAPSAGLLGLGPTALLGPTSSGRRTGPPSPGFPRGGRVRPPLIANQQ